LNWLFHIGQSMEAERPLMIKIANEVMYVSRVKLDKTRLSKKEKAYRSMAMNIMHDYGYALSEIADFWGIKYENCRVELRRHLQMLNGSGYVRDLTCMFYRMQYIRVQDVIRR